MRLRTLHLFHSYLNVTQNWSFSLLSEMSDVSVVIAAGEFQKCNFYNPNFQYIEFPIRPLPYDSGSAAERIYNKLAMTARTIYFDRYVARAVRSADVVHSHFATVGWERLQIAKYLKAPHLVSFYGFDYERLPQTEPVWRERYRELFREADLFLCEGAHAAGLLERQGCPPERIRIARLGVRPDLIEVIPRAKEPNELRLVQVANMTEKKGHRYSLDAFLLALKDCPNMTLTFVGSDKSGDGSSISAGLREVVRRAGVEDRVTFIPGIDFTRLHRFLGDYQVFLHPSVYAANRDSEGGAPIVLLDAQATGMPVISTFHCDIPEEVMNNRTGLLAPERDAESVAAHILRFYRMGRDEYEQFSSSARKHVETNYDIRHNASTLRQIYDDILIASAR